MTTFRSKIGSELIIPISILIVGLGSLMAWQRIWPGLVVVAGVAIFVAWIFLTISYQIDGKSLKIRCGLFFILKIDIDTIHIISETNNPLSSPATSIDRLEIKYQKDRKINTVMISPKDKTVFIKMITELNPSIEVRLNSKK